MPHVPREEKALLRAIQTWKITAEAVADSGPLFGQQATDFYALSSHLASTLTVRCPLWNPMPIIRLATLDPDRPSTRASRWLIADRAVAALNALAEVIWSASKGKPAGTEMAQPANQAAEPDATPSSPQSPAESPPAPQDYAALAKALDDSGKHLPSLLVAFMADRVTAAVRDIAKTVHSNPDASKAAIRQNMKRTNDALTKLGSRLHFFIRSGVMHREIAG